MSERRSGARPVEIRRLVKRDGELTAVDGVDLTVDAGDVYAVPTIALGSFALLPSVVTRRSVAAVVGAIFSGLLLEGLAALPAFKGARPYILATPLIGHAIWVSAVYIVPPLVAAWIVFCRRDVTT